MYSNTTKIATSSDTAVEVFNIGTGLSKRFALTIDNHITAVAGWWSVDGGTTWVYLPASSVINLSSVDVVGSVLVKRITGGSNLDNIWAYMYPVKE